VNRDGIATQELAERLLEEFGKEGAYLEAAQQGYAAQSEGRFYELSIWRDVKRILSPPE